MINHQSTEAICVRGWGFSETSIAEIKHWLSGSKHWHLHNLSICYLQGKRGNIVWKQSESVLFSLYSVFECDCTFCVDCFLRIFCSHDSSCCCGEVIGLTRVNNSIHGDNCVP